MKEGAQLVELGQEDFWHFITRTGEGVGLQFASFVKAMSNNCIISVSALRSELQIAAAAAAEVVLIWREHLHTSSL